MLLQRPPPPPDLQTPEAVAVLKATKVAYKYRQSSKNMKNQANWKMSPSSTGTNMHSLTKKRQAIPPPNLYLYDHPQEVRLPVLLSAPTDLKKNAVRFFTSRTKVLALLVLLVFVLVAKRQDDVAKPSDAKRLQVQTTDTILEKKNNATRTGNNWAIVMGSTDEIYWDLSLNYTKRYADRHGKCEILLFVIGSHAACMMLKSIHSNTCMPGYDVLSKTFDIIQPTNKDNNSIIKRNMALRYERKLVLILEALDKGYAYVYWKDTDVLIMDCDRSLGQLFHDEEVAKLKRWQSISNRTEQKLDAIFTGDSKGYICTGNMWLRNTPWVRATFTRALEIFKTSNPGPWQDQSAIQYTLLGEPLECREELLPCVRKCIDGGCEGNIPPQQEKHFSSMTQLSSFKSYSRRDGQFSVHFAD